MCFRPLFSPAHPLPLTTLGPYLFFFFLFCSTLLVFRCGGYILFVADLPPFFFASFSTSLNGVAFYRSRALRRAARFLSRSSPPSLSQRAPLFFPLRFFSPSKPWCRGKRFLPTAASDPLAPLHVTPFGIDEVGSDTPFSRPSCPKPPS